MKTLKLLPRTAVWYFYFAVSLLFMVPRVFLLKRKKKKLPPLEFTALANKYVQKWAKSQMKLMGAKPDIRGLENIPKDRAVVFISNHQSYVDIGSMLAFVDKPKGFVSKREVIKAPVISSYMKYINCVFMDRSDIKLAAKAINEGIQNIKNGNSMVIYPEGTRSKANTMLSWKAGSFKLATKSNAPIIPVTMYDSFMLLEENHYRIKPNKIIMIFGEPIETAGLSKEDQAELPDKIKQVIEGNLNSLSVPNR